jgi:hypothetical protein
MKELQLIQISSPLLGLRIGYLRHVLHHVLQKDSNTACGIRKTITQTSRKGFALRVAS